MVKLRDMVDMLKSIYPKYNYPKTFVEVDEGSLFSSEKLKMLGWECRRLEESLIDSVECYRDAGHLSKD
ncbi:putative Dihydroflavonol 4-reductase [Cocos nucifera]|nr:putative Dihydroflavonol 4-reductase [Cocos nucifera]